MNMVRRVALGSLYVYNANFSFYSFLVTSKVEMEKSRQSTVFLTNHVELMHTLRNLFCMAWSHCRLWCGTRLQDMALYVSTGRMCVLYIYNLLSIDSLLFLARSEYCFDRRLVVMFLRESMCAF